LTRSKEGDLARSVTKNLLWIWKRATIQSIPKKLSVFCRKGENIFDT